MRPLLSAAVVLGLSACAGARSPAAVFSGSGAESVSVDLLRPWPGADKIYVQVDLPGEVQGVFLVDTGASTSLLSAEMAETLGIAGVDNGQVIAGLGGTTTMFEGRLPYVDLNGIRVEDVAVAIGAPSLGPFSSWVPLDGILGNNVWGRLQLAIDYPADRMDLSWPGGLEIPADASPMSFDGSHLLVPVTLRAGEVGGDTVIERSLLLELDTGARGVMLTEFTGPGFEAVATDAEEPILGIGAAAHLPISSFYRPTRRVPLLRVDIGGVSVEDPGPAIWLNIDGRSRGLEMLGLVGYSVLQDHRLLLDFPGGRFALTESEGPARQIDGHQLLLDADVLAHGRDPERGLFRAGMHLALDDRPAAVIELDKYLKRHPGDAEALITRARVLRVDGDLDGYWAALSAVDAGALVDARELLAAANWAALSGRGDEALALGEAAIVARPEDPLGWVARSDTLYSHGALAAARAALDDAARLSQNPDAFLVRRARLAVAEGDEFAALSHLRRRLSLYPSDGSALLFYAQLATAPGDSDLLSTLRSDLDHALGRLHPDARPLDFALAARRLLGQDEAASALLAAGLDRDCAQIEGHRRNNCVAWYQALAGVDLEGSMQLILSAIEVDPYDPAFLDTLAMVHLARGETAEAAEAADAAARHAPDAIYHLWQAERLAALER